MKKTTLLLAITIGLASCEMQERGNKAPSQSKLVLDSTSVYFDQNYKVYKLEGCEYIVVGYGYARWGTHKGNCKNPIHK